MPCESNGCKGGELAREYGIWTHHKQPNGKWRFRLIARGGGSYVRAVAAPQGGLQNSHYHMKLRETFIVEEGWVVMAEWGDRAQEIELRRYAAGDIFGYSPMMKHNVYLAPRSMLHAITHGGNAAQNDWYSAADLDGEIKRFTLQDLVTFFFKGTPQ